MDGLTIYNAPPMPPNWDNVGIFYVSFAAIWTTILLSGMAFCWHNRNVPILKVRGLPLAFGSVIFLHLYWCLAQIAYPIGVTMPIVIAYDVQYFVMGTWFPLGFALYHASNLRFLHIAERQSTYAHPDLRQRKTSTGHGKSWLSRFRALSYMTRVISLIVAGIAVQIILTFAMWLVCKKYHPRFGVKGTDIKGSTLPEQLVDLGRGWEWWPSVVWQFVWTWMVAPYLILRSWHIRDTMGWRTQTIGTCLAGLHSTPMFLIASYNPAFNKVNMYFAPSQWFHLTTMIIEIFTVFVPCYQVVKLYLLRRQVQNSKSKWDTGTELSNAGTLVPSAKSSTINLVIEKEQVSIIVNDTQPDRLLTMTALNRVLTDHPVPLQEFSAYNDFSGENIAFLTSVAKFKDLFPKDKFELEGEQLIDVYNVALQIYVDYISPRDAEFPINVSSGQLKELEDVFESSARILCGVAHTDPVSPFFFDPRPIRQTSATDNTLLARYTGQINERFGRFVFDAVQGHVKNLVLTNTWPKFVREMQSRRRRSIDSEDSAESDGSQRTVVSQITGFIRSLKS